jgi:hypothetical protein
MPKITVHADTRLCDLQDTGTYELFVDAGVVMPWEVHRLATDERTLRTVCELGDLDLDEMLDIISDRMNRAVSDAMASAQGLARQGIDDA